MILSNLKPAFGSIKKGKRIARGQGSGKGGTATRGHKGAKSRSGYSKKIGFEGGQMPLQRRLPKFGFTNINRREYKVLNLYILQDFIDRGKISEKINFEDLVKSNLVRKNEIVKVLGHGELKSKIDIVAHKFTESAKKNIEYLGGSVTVII